MINMLRALTEIVDNIQEEMGNVNRKVESEARITYFSS